MGIQIKGSNDTISAADGSIVLEGATLTFTNENITGISTMASAEVTGNISIADKIIHTGDTNTAIRFPANDTISFESGGEEHCRVLDTGNFLVGATAVEDWDGSRSHRIQVRGTSSNNAGMSILATQDDDNPCELVLGKSRGTGNTIVGSGDDIGQIRFSANDGAGFHSVAWIRSTMDGAPGSNDLPSNLRFGTSADGGATVSERLRIDSRGNMGLGITPNDAWPSNGDFRAFQIGTGACVFGRGSGDEDRGGIAVNYYSDGSGNKYIGNGNAARVYLADGNIDFSNAAANASGADAAMTLEDRVRIDTSGRMLIGNTTSLNQYGSQSHLQVQGTEFDDSTIALRRDQNNANPPGVVFAKSRHGSLGGSTIVQDGDQIGAMIFAAADGTDLTSVTAVINVEIDGTPGSNDVPGRIVFETTADGASSPTERLRIDSTGRLLANTTNTNNVTAGGMKIQSAATDGVATVLNLRNPQLANGNAATRIEFNMDRSSGGIHFQAGAITVHKQQEWTSTPGTVDSYMTFSTILSESMTEKMRIASDGDVLIQATSSDMNSADNTGFSYQYHATGPYIRVKHAGAGSGYANYTLIHFVGATSMIGEIKQDGDGTITYATSSDYRLKENIVDLTGAITRVKNLKPKRFNFKLNSGLTKDGFLAHELQEVVPESVNGTKDEVVTADSKANNPTLEDLDVGDPVYQTADASRVVPLLTAALQEAITKIETLETKVAALESS